jgi:hypothetical protein
MEAYPIVLTIHSYLRWAVLILALVVIVRAAIGLSQRSAFTAGDARNGLLFMISADLQLLLGLLLYFWLSPFGLAAFQTPGLEPMKDASIRYWAVEHIAVMLVAWVLIHVGRSRTKKLVNDVARHRTALIFYGIALLLILSRIPFSDRPWFRS